MLAGAAEDRAGEGSAERPLQAPVQGLQLVQDNAAISLDTAWLSTASGQVTSIVRCLECLHFCVAADSGRVSQGSQRAAHTE